MLGLARIIQFIQEQIFKMSNVRNARNAIILIFCLISFPLPTLAQSQLQWKKSSNINFAEAFESLTLYDALTQLTKNYLQNPQVVKVDPSLAEEAFDLQGGSSNAETAFYWILGKYSLGLIWEDQQATILPKSSLWTQQPYQKTIISPIELGEVLDEMQEQGRVTIIRATQNIDNVFVSESLDFKSIQQGLQTFAKQYQWKMKYSSDEHIVYFEDLPATILKSIQLQNIPQTEAQEILKQATELLEESALPNIIYPSKNLVILKGETQAVETLATMLKELDAQYQKPVSLEQETLDSIYLQSLTESVFQDQILPILEEDENLKQVKLRWQKLEAGSLLTLYGQKEDVSRLKVLMQGYDEVKYDNPLQVVHRLSFDYVPVYDKKFMSEGESITQVGAGQKLQNLLSSSFSQTLEDDTPEFTLSVEPASNALIFQGSSQVFSHLRQIKNVLDQPPQLVEIEAYIFETSEKFSRRIGFEMRATGAGPNIQSAEIPSESFAVRNIIGAKSLRVSTLLQLMEQEGKGRVLSRPKVITLNNKEAEIQSGDVIHIRHKTLSGKEAFQRFNVGVTLKVTPRVIETDNPQKTAIKLFVFAESSSFVEGVPLGDLPRTNSQSAKSEVIVKNGEPFLLGGLIRQHARESEQGIPFLKDIPILGAFFRNSQSDNQLNHIMVFVTPTLVTKTSQLLPKVKDFIQTESEEETNKND